MADYWGLVAIGRRMGVDASTVRIWHRTNGFLMYLRYRYKRKPAWYTNDTLIHAWELSRCAQDHTSPLAMRIGRKRETLP